jgi:phosphotriesterase-related protein
MTVLGPIEPEQLGFTSMHEHILSDERHLIRLAPKEIQKKLEHIIDDPITLDNLNLIKRFECSNVNMTLDDEEVMAAEVSDFKDSGGSALVDMSPLGIRIDAAGIQRISEKTGVHIITTTGAYLADDLSGDIPRGDDLKNLMMKEIEEGIDDTGVKAGHIKMAIDDLTETNVEDFRAVARIINETGLSVSVHTGSDVGSDGRRIAKIFSEEGMDLERFIHCHSGDFIGENRNFHKLVLEPERWGLRLDYARELLDQGVTLAFDEFGFQGIIYTGQEIPPDWKRMAAVVALIKEGYSSQIVLGTDVGVKTQVRRYGGYGYAHLTNFVEPTLREVDVSDNDIRLMTVENPRKLLAF